MGVRLLTDDKPVIIFRKDKQTSNGGKFATYCMGISSKDKDGNWVNGFLDVVFKIGVEVNNKAKINIKNAFPTVSKYNEKTYIKWMILEFDVVDNGEVPQQAPTPSENWMNIPDGIDNSLPFD